MADRRFTVQVGAPENVDLSDNSGIVCERSSTLVSGNQRPLETELNKSLNPITDASHMRNRKTSPPDSDCFPGTRTGIIRKISTWANSNVLLKPAHVFFLYGDVGCGKSSISQAVSQKYGRKGRLPASFFFHRDSGDRSKMDRFAVTLSSQMMAAIPATRPFIEAAVKAQPALLTGEVSLTTQLESLVYQPFQAVVSLALMLKALFKGPFLIVIDGLDECEDKDKVKEFIEHLLDFFKRHPHTPLRFFITGRLEQHICASLNTDGVILDDLVAYRPDDDILIFLEMSFLLEAERDPVLAASIQTHGHWSTQNYLKMLVKHVGGSFIFATALLKYIIRQSDDGLNPMTRLPLAVNLNPDFDGLYTHTLARSQDLPHFSNVIATLALLVEPLPVTGIAELLGVEVCKIHDILVKLKTILHIPGSDDLPVTFGHTSLREFLTTKSRSGPFFASPSYHFHLVKRCFILRNEFRQGGSVGASYSENHCEKHLDHLTGLPSATQGPAPRFSATLDALYTDILTKSKDLPHFTDIISTLVLLFTPLPLVGIAGLLDIQDSEVVQVLSNLRAIIRIPASAELPVTIRHTSLRDFLTTEGRSKFLFISPSYHLYLSYRCSLYHGWGSYTTASSYSNAQCQEHLEAFSQLPPNMQGLPHHFSQTRLDAIYHHVLGKARHLPHLYDIISTLVLLFEPLPIVGIAELLSVETHQVVDVLNHLRALIRIPTTDDSPVTLICPSVRDFFTTEARSGLFFTPLSIHLNIWHQCLVLRQKQPTGAPTASYVHRFAEAHIQQYILSEPSDQEIFRPTPQTLDVFYTRILSRSQNLPYFSDVMSTLAVLLKSLPIFEIAQLLGLQSFEVNRVFASLRGIIHIRVTNGLPSPMCPTSLRDFLTTKGRSGPFFVLPSHHLKLAYSLTLGYGHWSSIDDIDYPQGWWWDHFRQFLNQVPERSIVSEIVQLSLRQPRYSPDRHLFSFILLFFWIFGNVNPKPQHFLDPFSKCFESLALALERDWAPGAWLNKSLRFLGFETAVWMDPHVYTFTVDQKDAIALQNSVRRVQNVIKEKCPQRLSAHLAHADTGTVVENCNLDEWTPVHVFWMFEWIAARVELEADLEGPGSTCDLSLHLTQISEESRMTIRATARPTCLEPGINMPE